MPTQLKAVNSKKPTAKVDASGVSLRSDVDVVQVRHDECLTNDEAIAALSRFAAAAADRGDTDAVFQRDAELVRVLRLDHEEKIGGVKRAAGSARIAPLPAATLRETLTRAASFQKVVKVDGKSVYKNTSPPDWCVKAVVARGRWDGLPRLTGVVTFPTLRANGSLLQKPGYDGESGLMYIPTGPVDAVPDAPSRDDAARAVNTLLDVLADFPFANEGNEQTTAHHAAAIAAMLTPLARPAFCDSVSPMFVVEASVRATGKTLLVDTIGIILTGEPIARMRFPGADDPNGEFRKLVTTVALSGDRICLLDNVTGMLGGATLDTLLTAPTWTDRLLTTMKQITAPLNACWFATSNNASLGGDTARRVLPIRLESPHERPEERKDFRIPDIRKHVRAERPRLLAAALTILRGYYAAGCPKQVLAPWGSYEDFDRIVRSAVIWAGLPDPCLTRAGLTVSATTEDDGVRDLVHGLKEMIDSHPMGKTRGSIQAGEIARSLNSVTDTTNDPYSRIRNGLEALRDDSRGNLDPQKVGLLLRRYRGRWVDGLQIQTGPEVNGSKTWRIAAR